MISKCLQIYYFIGYCFFHDIGMMMMIKLNNIIQLRKGYTLVVINDIILQVLNFHKNRIIVFSINHQSIFTLVCNAVNDDPICSMEMYNNWCTCNGRYIAKTLYSLCTHLHAGAKCMTHLGHTCSKFEVIDKSNSLRDTYKNLMVQWKVCWLGSLVQLYSCQGICISEVDCKETYLNRPSANMHTQWVETFKGLNFHPCMYM